MNFIIEFLPKFGVKDVNVVVVRASNGFPMGCFDTLDDATKFIRSELVKAKSVKADVKR